MDTFDFIDISCPDDSVSLQKTIHLRTLVPTQYMNDWIKIKEDFIKLRDEVARRERDKY